MFSSVREKGMVALAFVMIILFVITIVTLFSAQVIVTENKIYDSAENNIDALNAAQAGVDSALVYLNRNVSSVTGNASPTGLDVCASASNTVCLASNTLQACTSSPEGPTTTLSNNATYTMKFSCVTASDTTTLKITSYGVSADGSATRTVSAIVKSYVYGSAINYPPPSGSGASSIPLVTSGAVSLSQSSNLTASSTGATVAVISGGALTFANSATVIAGGTTLNRHSPVATYSPTIQQNTAGVAAMTNAQMQTTYLGDAITNFANYANIILRPGGNTTYSNTTSSSGSNAWAGKIVYLDMSTAGDDTPTTNTATFQSAFYAGTTNNPALIVVNGNVDIQGSSMNAATVIGGVYANGALTITQAATVTGLIYGNRLNIQGGSGTSTAGAGVAGSGGAVLNQSGTITLSSQAALNGLRFRQYNIIPGSWKDF
ncbi:MAG: hypothetical protein A3C44_01830 [Gammaproteobacteria bacterium RIFCSPHIGHO2_02_FULL_39_13]|nr:MAG: hypothetical protein A3C44_01830 [Gammaproteobacteria bacterium RIFCSPHIGHO2_02_FULL_39_13]OGT49620.1 MAG: hypothetical protein A3E53_00575 [Gammaproteobacteria bacterium RIFCSPHIGHO2_12_FULL_39_24]